MPVQTRSQPRTLSKSDFILARTCDAKLWFRENRYPDNRNFDPYLKLLAEGGYMVEALAAARYPDGINLEYGGNPADDFATTMEYLKQDSVTLFQGTLLWNRRLARADIIQKTGNKVRLIEVKAKSFDGAEHLKSLGDGKLGVFRNLRKPHDVSAKWREKLEDLTYQTLILERLLPGVEISPFLMLVDTSKRAGLDSIPQLFEIDRRPGPDGTERLHSARYTGTQEQLAELDLLTEVDLSAEVAMLRAEIEREAARFETMLDAEWSPAFPQRGARCRDCEFRLDEPDGMSGFDKCWGDLARVQPHMLELYSIGKARDQSRNSLADSLVADGKASLLDIPEACLVKTDGTVGPESERQRRQVRCTRTGETWIGPQLREKISSLKYPLHFIDFEVARLALPYHANMRAYGQVVFQWSCHSVTAPGAAPVHSEWLNTVDIWPNQDFVRSLRRTVGDSDTLIEWSPFERSRLEEISRELEHFVDPDPETVDWIANVRNREFDMHKSACNDFYHPAMRGRTSIKVVLDALWKSDPLMRARFAEWTGVEADELNDPYATLPALEINGVPQDVREGTGAVRAYHAMMYGVERRDEIAKKAWCDLLLQYCRLDTLSMVLILEHWQRITSA